MPRGSNHGSPTAFTPGPWRACGSDRGGCSCGHVWSLPADFHVATAHKSWGDDPDFPDAEMSPEEMRGNARLIAAAPELYDALAEARQFVAYYPADSKLDQRGKDLMLAQIDALLAKARGDQ